MEKMRKENVYNKGDITGCKGYVAPCRRGDAPAPPPAICRRRIQSWVRMTKGGSRPRAGGRWWGGTTSLKQDLGREESGGASWL